MGIRLCSNEQALLTTVTAPHDARFVALLHRGESALAPKLEQVVDDLIVVDIQGPRLGRLNFDAVSTVVLELPTGELLSSGGRRLVDVLGRLAEESLDLVLYGPACTAAGAFLPDGVTAGLNLVPAAVVLPDIQAVPELHGLLAGMSERGLRLLALDATVTADYTVATDLVTATGPGNALLVGFVATPDGSKTARLLPLTDGMQRPWPA